MRYTISFLLATLPMLAGAEVPRVVTDIVPVQALVAQVMGGLGAPVLLLSKGADEHDFALRPSQSQALAEADLVVWIGPGLTPWLERALDGTGGAQLALLSAAGTETRAYGAGNGAEAHGADAHGAEEHGADAHGAEAHGAEEHGAEAHGADSGSEGDAGHDHAGVDPHVWLDPGNAGVWLGLIAAELARIDPANAAVYASNAALAAKDLRGLDAQVAAILAPVKDQPFVAFHDAYAYFIAHYGLQMVGALREGDAAAPGAARIAALRDELAAGGVVCVFPEAQHDPAMLVQLVEGTAVKLGAAIDPVGSTLEPGPQAYAAVLTGLAQALADCLRD